MAQMPAWIDKWKKDQVREEEMAKRRMEERERNKQRSEEKKR